MHRIRMTHPDTGETVLATDAGADVLIERGYALEDEAAVEPTPEPTPEPEVEPEPEPQPEQE